MSFASNLDMMSRTRATCSRLKMTNGCTSSSTRLTADPAYDRVVAHRASSIAKISATQLLFEPLQTCSVTCALIEAHARADLKTVDVVRTSNELEDDAPVAIEESRDIRAGCVMHDCWSSLGIALCAFGTTQVGFHRYSQFAS